eukprot:320552-Chlamydomonas_euryale.AAC.18
MAGRAMNTIANIVQPLLLEAGGYLVELNSSGMCLAAFQNPLHAIAWSLCLIDALKVDSLQPSHKKHGWEQIVCAVPNCVSGHLPASPLAQMADWEDDLLEHELCETVKLATRVPASPVPRLATDPMPAASSVHMVEGSARSEARLARSGGDGGMQTLAKRSSLMCCSSESAHVQNIMFRGPRVKIGIDAGKTERQCICCSVLSSLAIALGAIFFLPWLDAQVSTDVSLTTGRMCYQGSARECVTHIVNKAHHGTVWCSARTWGLAKASRSSQVATVGIKAETKGKFSIKVRRCLERRWACEVLASRVAVVGRHGCLRAETIDHCLGLVTSVLIMHCHVFNHARNSLSCTTMLEQRGVQQHKRRLQRRSNLCPHQSFSMFAANAAWVAHARATMHTADRCGAGACASAVL